MNKEKTTLQAKDHREIVDPTSTCLSDGNSVVDKVVDALAADYDRQDGYLKLSQVERLFEKRDLSIEQINEVHRRLNLLDIHAEDDLAHFDDSNPKNGELSNLPKKYFRHKLLSANEEVDLGRKMELGRRAQQEVDLGTQSSSEHLRLIKNAEQAKETMVHANLRLVMYVAKRYIGFSSLDSEDLAQEGMIGLIRAVEKFDHSIGCKFSTYATWWIRQAVTRAIADSGTTIRFPVHVSEKVYQYKKALRILRLERPERRVTLALLADELAWPIDQVHFIQQLSMLAPLSLDEYLEEGGDTTLVDTLASDLPTPEEQYTHAELQRCIVKALSSLSERESEVLCLRNGLTDTEECSTLEEIGQMYGLTRERIRQIESKALKKLKYPSRSGSLVDFANVPQTKPSK